MKNDLSYETSEGFTVFTSLYLKKKGTCCKSACLHCPYGFTLKKLGLQFQDISLEDSPLIDRILTESGAPAVDWRAFDLEHVKILVLKNTICGFMLKTKMVVKHVFLLPHFQSQDLSKEMVESYYFI